MFKDKVILVVDDEADLRDILIDEIEVSLGSKTFAAKNGNDAWNLLQKEKVDLVLSDVRMPGGDGVELARRVKTRDSVNPPLVLISGFSDFDRRDAFDLGVEGYLAKPFHLDDVIRRVEFLLTPAHERQLKPHPSLATIEKKSLSVPNDDLAWDLKHLGRGGFCLHGKNDKLRQGDWVDFEWQNLKGTGYVQWSVHIGETDSMCTGIEIWCLQEGHSTFQDFVKNHKPKAYIPK